jgi:hypothetical protein
MNKPIYICDNTNINGLLLCNNILKKDKSKYIFTFVNNEFNNNIIEKIKLKIEYYKKLYPLITNINTFIIDDNNIRLKINYNTFIKLNNSKLFNMKDIIEMIKFKNICFNIKIKINAYLINDNSICISGMVYNIEIIEKPNNKMIVFDKQPLKYEIYETVSNIIDI